MSGEPWYSDCNYGYNHGCGVVATVVDTVKSCGQILWYVAKTWNLDFVARVMIADPFYNLGCELESVMCVDDFNYGCALLGYRNRGDFVNYPSEFFF